MKYIHLIIYVTYKVETHNIKYNAAHFHPNKLMLQSCVMHKETHSDYCNKACAMYSCGRGSQWSLSQPTPPSVINYQAERAIQNTKQRKFQFLKAPPIGYIKKKLKLPYVDLELSPLSSFPNSFNGQRHKVCLPPNKYVVLAPIMNPISHAQNKEKKRKNPYSHIRGLHIDFKVYIWFEIQKRNHFQNLKMGGKSDNKI